MIAHTVAAILLAAGLTAVPTPRGGLRAQQPDSAPRFDHYRHRRLFPTCVSCHQGAEDPDQPLWPDTATCNACHDGTNRPKVAWRPPTEEHPSNLKFVHDLVPLMTRQTPQGTESLACKDCHTPAGGEWMVVQRATPERCLECHGTGAPHLASPDTLCSTCHLPLPRAAGLTATRVAAFPVPPSHRVPGGGGGFMSRTAAGHGALATGTKEPVAPSCAVCHARDFCITCHVDAPEQRAIQALEPDPRARAIVVRLQAPATHREPTFLQRHGAAERANPRQCSTCHTQESCLGCHAPSQHVAAALPARGPGRGLGAQPARRPPDSHRENFANRHASVAATTPATCAGCHVRTDCLECHRPNAAAAPGYHPAGFLTRHPASAYARETRCSDCHNVGSFCSTCHASAGLVSSGPLRAGYHDGSRFFSVGHGQAARQSLETCIGCHVERDCLTCHSAVGGRHVNPHGPGFDAARMRRKNPEMCTACHGAAIPGN
jgi:hypothetical protein